MLFYQTDDYLEQIENDHEELKKVVGNYIEISKKKT